MVKYVNVKTYKNGVKRKDGSGRNCILNRCGSTATVKADNVRFGKRMEVALCPIHATEHGVI